ncbi:hypothetical protein BT69DRAFT_1328346 [Atractiella rhizophila]|nr:hypothetical protein BT69DRAFT_1328346 [Atractiella rhizophila]
MDNELRALITLTAFANTGSLFIGLPVQKRSFSDPGTASSLKGRFLDTLAHVLSRKGAEYVTATAMVEKPDEVTIKVAMNSGLHSKSASFCKDLEEFANTISKLPSGSCEKRANHVHAEIQIVFHLASASSVNLFPYIGCSKLSCVLCDRFLASLPGELSGLKTQGCHGKFYPKWTLPTDSSPPWLLGTKQRFREKILGIELPSTALQSGPESPPWGSMQSSLVSSIAPSPVLTPRPINAPSHHVSTSDIGPNVTAQPLPEEPGDVTISPTSESEGNIEETPTFSLQSSISVAVDSVATSTRDVVQEGELTPKVVRPQSFEETTPKVTQLDDDTANYDAFERATPDHPLEREGATTPKPISSSSLSGTNSAGRTPQLVPESLPPLEPGPRPRSHPRQPDSQAYPNRSTTRLFPFDVQPTPSSTRLPTLKTRPAPLPVRRIPTLRPLTASSSIYRCPTLSTPLPPSRTFEFGYMNLKERAAQRHWPFRTREEHSQPSLFQPFLCQTPHDTERRHALSQISYLEGRVRASAETRTERMVVNAVEEDAVREGMWKVRVLGRIKVELLWHDMLSEYNPP